MKQGFYNTLGGGVRIVIAMLTVPVLIRTIGLEEYGLWALVAAMLGVIALLEGGLCISTTSFVARDLARDDCLGVAQTLTANFGAMLVLATLAGGLLWFGADTVRDHFPGLTVDQRMAASKALRISGLVVWARLLQQVVMGVEQAFQRYGLMNAISTGQSALSNLGMLAVGSLGGRVVELMKWQLLVSALMLATHGIAAWRLVRPLRLRPAWDPAKSREVWRYSLLTWVSTLGTALFSRCDRLFVGGILGASGLGVYAAITTITAQINALSALPVQPLLPLISTLRGVAGAQDASAQRRIQQGTQMNALVAFGLGAVMVLLAPEIIAFAFPETMSRESLWAFRAGTIIFALYSLNAVGYYLLLGSGAAGVCTVVVAANGLIALASIAVGAATGGVRGAILGTGAYVGTILLTFLGLRRLGWRPSVWCQWIRFPVMWLAAVLPLNLLWPADLVTRVGVALAETVILLLWFLRTQRISPGQALEQMRKTTPS